MNTFKQISFAILAAFGASAQAQVVLDSNGYFRAGPGATSKDHSRACYGLPGADFKYRLGNECDVYGEFLFSAAVAKSDGQEFKLFFMPNVYKGNSSDAGDAKFGIQQLYAQGKGLDFAPDVTFWIGKQYHRGADVHIVDTFFEQLLGTGGGASIPMLGGKLDVAYYRSDAAGSTANPTTYVPPGNRFNAWLRDIPANEGGSLNILTGLTKGDGTNGKSGGNISVRHTQKFGETSSNNVWLQYAQGSGGLDGNFGNLTAGSDVKRWRLIDGYQFQFTPQFGGQAIAMYEQRKSNAGDEKVTSIGGRVAYALTRNFKLLGEVGVDRVKPDGAPARNLTKVTFAPTLSTGPGFWARPELRLYVTHATWNQAANDAAGAGGLAGLGDAKTKGTSAGLQVEIWW